MGSQSSDGATVAHNASGRNTVDENGGLGGGWVSVVKAASSRRTP